MLTALSGFARPLAFASQCAGWLSGVGGSKARQSNSPAFGLESTLPAPKATVRFPLDSGSAKQDPIYIKESRRKNVSFAITCFSSESSQPHCRNKKPTRKPFQPPSSASFGRRFWRLCSFRCRTFFGTCLEPSKEVLVQGVERWRMSNKKLNNSP